MENQTKQPKSINLYKKIPVLVAVGVILVAIIIGMATTAWLFTATYRSLVGGNYYMGVGYSFFDYLSAFYSNSVLGLLVRDLGLYDTVFEDIIYVFVSMKWMFYSIIIGVILAVISYLLCKVFCDEKILSIQSLQKAINVQEAVPETQAEEKDGEQYLNLAE